jgi:hypothetical protein
MIYVYWFILIYLLTPWSRVFLRSWTVFAANQEISPILWNPKVLYRTHKCPPPVSTLSQLHPVPTTPSNFLNINLNIILPSTSGSPQQPLSLRLPHQQPLHSSFLTHTRHMILIHTIPKYAPGFFITVFLSVTILNKITQIHAKLLNPGLVTLVLKYPEITRPALCFQVH